MCAKEWSLAEVRRVAMLTAEQNAHFEEKLNTNYLLKAAGVQACPGCRCYCERMDTRNMRVICRLCTAREGTTYEWCWECLQRWQWSGAKCRHPSCRAVVEERLEILRSCGTKSISGITAPVPVMRACPGCGALNEHKTAW